MPSYKERDVEANRREYGEWYDSFEWISEDRAARATRERAEILASLSSRVQLGFLNTKLDCRDLSPGCLICGRGEWSCLFINSLCNARCFYCPTEQPSRSEPITNGIRFANPQDYADYVERFKIRGVGLSGGEPLLTFDRTLQFLTKIKRRFGDSVHVWLYTNGILATREKFIRLKEAGLDEIRFDISANGYDLDRVREAVGLIETVTVEIPAIPEDFDLLCRLIIELEKTGIQYLNLHQLRATPHNARNLVKRGYTFLHGPKVTVLESELAALRIIQYTRDRGIRLPLNYCSFVYKNGFQTLAYRKRLATFLCRPFESITAAGAVRRISLKGQPGPMDGAVHALRRNGCDETLWRVDGAGGRLSFHPSLWPHIDHDRFSLSLDYDLPFLTPTVSYRYPFVEIPLNRHKTVILEKRPALKGRTLSPSEARTFSTWFLTEGVTIDPDPWRHDAMGRGMALLGDIAELERIRPGLQEYY